MTSPDLIVPVLLCGGSGTRLYPLSTPETPKQFLRLFSNGETLFERTITRAQRLGNAGVVVASKAHQKQLEKVYTQSLWLQESCVVLENQPKNTAVAALLGAYFAREKSENALVCLMPCDHYIENVDGFAEQLKAAAAFAQTDHMVLFGAPARASSQFGMITYNPFMIADGPFYAVSAFTEKPALETSRNTILSGFSFTNSGVYLVSAAGLIRRFGQLHPQLSEAVKVLHDNAVRVDNGFLSLMYSEFLAGFHPISFDVAVVEKGERLVVAPISWDWADIGSVEALRQAAGSKDQFSDDLSQKLVEMS